MQPMQMINEWVAEVESMFDDVRDLRVEVRDQSIEAGLDTRKAVRSLGEARDALARARSLLYYSAGHAALGHTDKENA